MSLVDFPMANKDMMPDVASKVQAKTEGTLDWVGMSEIEMPVLLQQGDEQFRIGASVQAYVNLVAHQAKGIHMSRLYLLLDDMIASKPLSITLLTQLLEAFVQSHLELSNQAMVELKFDYYLRRPSLKSEYSGWKSYPIKITGHLNNDQIEIELSCQIPYASTCPCSAALARHLIQQQFEKDFKNQTNIDAQALHAWLGSEQGVVATPHSQRSIADIKVKLQATAGDEQQDSFPIVELIDVIEQCLKTPVQAAVKREDEQEFARLNGQNLMFCEDAARRIQATLNAQQTYLDYWVRVDHLESLHAHDAVSIVTKGVKNGYKSVP